MMKDLAGKIAVVTGGSRGIGKAIASKLSSAGAIVVISGRNKEALEAAAHEIGGKIIPIPVQSVT